MNCREEYNTKEIQEIQTKGMQLFLDVLIKDYGGLPVNAAVDYRRGFKRRFMSDCKKRMTKSKSKPKSKTRRL
jgi:hypothetical protein